MTRSLGEAYFLRAHYYFILVRCFGGVPIRTEPAKVSDPKDIARVNGRVDQDTEDYITQTLLTAIFKFRFGR